MPTLPIIDLLIFLGWSTITIGAVLKAIYVTTSYRPTFVGLTPMDCVILAGCFLLFALTLAARTWVKGNEPRMLAERRSAATRLSGAYVENSPSRNGALGNGAPRNGMVEAQPEADGESAIALSPERVSLSR